MPFRSLSRDIDLVILCHTIPEQEKAKLIASMKERNKRTPIISIHANGEADGKLVDDQPNVVAAGAPSQGGRA